MIPPCDAASKAEAVTQRHAPNRDRRLGSHLAIACGLLGCLGLPRVWALPNLHQPDKASSQTSPSSGSSRSTPPRLVITPNGATLAPNQTQHFKVTDANGKSVAVHWDVSGISCSGSACGTVDGDGTYHAPQLMAKVFVVVLEGVLVSDAKHSVLTRIQLAPASVATPVPAAKAAVEFSPLISHGPLVAYQGGQLTIDAENSTLAAVLEKVAEKTGAVIDVPPGSGLDPIVEHAGPGPANDVLTQLLNGSHFNFIIVDSPQYPDEPVQVLLSVKESGDIPKSVPTPAPAVAAAAELTPADDGASLTAPPTPPSAQVSATAAPAAPAEKPSPEALGQMMRDRARQIRENSQQQQPQQQEQEGQQQQPQ